MTVFDKLGIGRSSSDSPTAHTHNAHSFPPVPPQTLRVIVSPSPNLALENVIAVPPGTFHDGQYVICDGKFVFSVRVIPNMEPGTLGASGAQREWAQWSQFHEAYVESFDIFAGNNSQVYLASLELEIDFYKRPNTKTYEQSDLAKQLLQVQHDHIFSPGQIFPLEFGGTNFKVMVTRTDVIDLTGTAQPSGNRRGLLTPQTEIIFRKAAHSAMQLKGARQARTNLLQNNFSFEHMGIGGLDEEFWVLFRRAFASRVAPPRDVERLGIKHVKGVLLYGPPGTGKTLIARQIGKMLNTVEPKIVNGPEMLSKFVGGSEENIRKLFKDAEDEQKAKGEDSNLHIIIFDELDAVFKQRGSRSDGTGVGDNVVNQLLAKMDGVDELNNILIIGMTNRKDLIDVALMRPGRFEVQLEIPLPDAKGRQQILTIHTAKMRKEKILASDVDMKYLASKTKNCSGAELEGLVKAAAGFAMKRNFITTKEGRMTFDSKAPLKVTAQDFNDALEGLTPAFGVSELDLQELTQGGIIQFSEDITNLLARGQQLTRQVTMGDLFPRISVLFHGPSGSGKSALAAQIALATDFPMVKLIGPKALMGMNESQKIAHIQNVFLDAYKTPMSVVLLDQLEQIIDWVDVGPRFSNAVLQAIMVFVRQQPPAGKRLLVLGTTSKYDVMKQVGLAQHFNQELYVPNVMTVSALGPILDDTEFMEPRDRAELLQSIRAEAGGDKLGVIGIKDVLYSINSAKASNHPADALKEMILDAVHGNLWRSVGNFQ